MGRPRFAEEDFFYAEVRPVQTAPGPKCIAMVKALLNGWTYGSIDTALKMQFVRIIYKAGHPYLLFI